MAPKRRRESPNTRKQKNNERRRLKRATMSPDSKAKEAERRRQQRQRNCPQAQTPTATREACQPQVSPATRRRNSNAARMRLKRAEMSPSSKAKEAERKRRQRWQSRASQPDVPADTEASTSKRTFLTTHPRLQFAAATNYFTKHFVQNAFGATSLSVYCSIHGTPPVVSTKAVQTEATGCFSTTMDIAVGTTVVDRGVCQSTQTLPAAEKVHRWADATDFDVDDSGLHMQAISAGLCHLLVLTGARDDPHARALQCDD
ncbi:uncharacterized protein LOC142564172 isoform X2 [Dermacentor variabilis]|uniref:uncharacterized protein LOC142564172 isoform X2 n=1 Tax=Dermacentor variabilis TaxID=34621 RepID=UPI003F5BF9E7